MNRTTHRFISSDARAIDAVSVGRPSLVVTSPPYPMISMWDESFSGQSGRVREALRSGDGQTAFIGMHEILDDVWRACHAVLVEGGIACINIGDAVRTIAGAFQLYPNASRVTEGLATAGFTPLPPIIWRKPTNSPTKFMGSGMLPGGAYVTLEHEMILIARKGGLRRPKSKSEQLTRRRSAIFWHERNEWYSDLWMLKGVRQAMGGPRSDEGDLRQLRDRSAAFPLEIAYRLVAMHSWMGDVVLDPFAGTGTTAAAAAALGRSSVSVERDRALVTVAAEWVQSSGTVAELSERSRSRIRDHEAFTARSGRRFAHVNATYGFPVMTSQEVDLEIPLVSAITRSSGDGTMLECEYRAPTDGWKE